MGFLDYLKAAVKLVQEIDNIPLMRSLMNAQTEGMALLDENRALKQENERLEEAFKIKGDLFFEGNAYWMKEPEDKKSGPFCSGCWDDKIKLVRMVHSHNRSYYRCPVCSNSFVEE